jgi:hypothetical protein
MQSDPKYTDAEVSVDLAADVEDEAPDRAEFLRDHLGVPTDGRVIVTRPPMDNEDESNRDDGRWIVATIPFRDHRKDDAPWAAFPDKQKGRRQPIWKWENPEDDPEDITLSPSYGRKKGTDGAWSGEWEIHCWIKNGDLDLL